MKFLIGSEASKNRPKVLDFCGIVRKALSISASRKIVAKAQEVPQTKRNLLSVLASKFDPLGIISPITVFVKMLFQELCHDIIGYHDELKGKAKKKWNDFQAKMAKNCQRAGNSKCMLKVAPWRVVILVKMADGNVLGDKL